MSKTTNELDEDGLKKKILPDLPFTKKTMYQDRSYNEDGSETLSPKEKDMFLDQVVPHMKPVPTELQEFLTKGKRSKAFDEAIQKKAVELFTVQDQRGAEMAAWKNRYDKSKAIEKNLKEFGEFVDNHVQALDIIVQSSIIQGSQKGKDAELITSQLLPILAESGHDDLVNNRDKLVSAINESVKEGKNSVPNIVESFTYKKLAIDHEKKISELATFLAGHIEPGQDFTAEKQKEAKTKIVEELSAITKGRDTSAIEKASEVILIEYAEAAGQPLTIQQKISKITDSIKECFPIIFSEHVKAKKYSAILSENQNVKHALSNKSNSQVPVGKSRTSVRQGNDRPMSP